MHHTAAKLEELLTRAAVAPVLLNRIGHGLFGEAVLQLKGGNGQTVDEEAEVERAAGCISAIGQLARDGEAVLPVQPGSLYVALRGCAVEKVEVKSPMLNALAQHINHTTLADFGGEAGKKLEAVDITRFIRLCKDKLCEWFGLRGMKKGEELRNIKRVCTVILFWSACDISGSAVGCW